ncbi:uncharacterized protein C14orf132 isoform X2 [Amia ocellicauda]|uniref:uncharacterized protein C14orf132 isoform X2 n=1 Tax=Amia ocellicauda TaxID=2972642 RepID=UPI0034643492
MELSLMAAQHFPAMSGAFMDSPYNGNTSLQTSTSNLHANFNRPQEPEEEAKLSSEAIWLWVAIIATIGNIVVVAVLLKIPWHTRGQLRTRPIKQITWL